MLHSIHECCDKLEAQAVNLREQIAEGVRLANCGSSKALVHKATLIADEIERLLEWELRPIANRTKRRRRVSL